MRTALKTLIVVCLFSSTGYGQLTGSSYRIPDPMQSSGDSPQRVEKLASGLKSRVAALSHHIPKQPEEGELGISQQGIIQFQPGPIGSGTFMSSSSDMGAGIEIYQDAYPGFSTGYRPSTSFNATQRISPILANPDQFWNRKMRPVVDVRNQAMFGIDPECTCDEWEGFCGCCGLKAGPGHLGIPWLRGNDPCGCVECRRLGCRKCHKCR